MLSLGDLIELEIEKPAAGGRMLARHDGQVVFVAGAIPGERARVQIEERRGGVLLGSAIDILVPSADRRAVSGDAACGGRAFAHIAYARQLVLKEAIVRDAFLRIAKIPLPDAIATHASPEEGYRMRARLHTKGGRLGFYREGTHTLCEPAASAQLLPQTVEILDRLAAVIGVARLADVVGVDLAESCDGLQRAVAIEVDDERPWRGMAAAWGDVEGITGLAVLHRDRLVLETGALVVTDDLQIAHPNGSRRATLTIGRHVLGFFQSNRYLLGQLVDHIVALIPDGPLTDLYAGGGLFGLSHAALDRGPVLAVESDPISVGDLQRNAQPFGGRVRIAARRVEGLLHDDALAGGTLLVDPPRTGMSRDVISALADRLPAQMVYVSCDVATLARDVGRFVARGAHIERVDVFDLFPGTAHVETVVALRH
jgi:23S rRNA (uracil1939-C5)-methyltransferase